MDDETQNIGNVSPEEAMRQLVELRLQVGQSRFRTLAGQMGMPGDLLEYVEQVASQVESSQNSVPGGVSPLAAGGGRGNGGSGLVDASGRPIGGGASPGLVDASGRPIGGGLGAIPQDEEDEEEFDGEDGEDEITLSEDESRRLFQELVGVRMLIGPENFTTLTEQMGMPQEANDLVENAATQVEDEIASRYENQDEAMTVRLVNARMMMGQERFNDLAGQIGMPQQVIDDVEQIAGDLEMNAADGDDDDPTLSA
jgi:hypothetical protein